MSGDPAFEAGRMFGRILFPILLIVGGALLGRYLGRRRNPPRFVSWPVSVAVILAVLTLLLPSQARGGGVQVEAVDG